MYVKKLWHLDCWLNKRSNLRTPLFGNCIVHFSQLIIQTALGLNIYCYTCILLSLLREIGRPTSAHSFNTTAAFHSWHLHHHVWCVTVRLPTFLFPHTEKMDFMVMLSWSPATCWCLYLPVHLVDKVMVKRVQERIHKWSGVSCLKEYAEGAWRCEAEMECKILFPRINFFPGSAKWLGILSCTLPRHGQCVSVCAGSGNTWVC